MNDSEKLNEKIAGLMSACYPLNAMVEVTRRCNAQCGYCYVLQEPASDDLPLAVVKRIFDRLDDAGVLCVGISGGEPFLRADILDILAYCIEKNFFTISILTNGTLLDDRAIRFLIEHRRHISYLRMSAFSHDARIHDAYTGVPGGLDAIVRNGGALIEGGVNVHLLLNILDINIDTFEESRRYFNQKGFLATVGVRKLGTTPALAARVAPFVTEKFYRTFFERCAPESASAMAEGLRQSCGGEANPNMCAGISSSITVNWRGDILPCVSFRRTKIGSILNEPWPGLRETLLASAEYHRLRSLTKNDIPLCKSCRHSNYCELCLGIVYSHPEGRDTASEQFCNYARALEQYEDASCTPNG